MRKKIILGMFVMAALVVLAGCEAPDYFNQEESTSKLKPEVAKAKMVKFINEELLQGKQQVDIQEFVPEGDLYRAKIKVGEQELVVYITADGKKFFPQVIDVDELAAQGQNQPETDKAKTPENIPQQAIPEVKLFVMSYCPFGTQIEKGMLPVLKTLDDKIKFKLEFVDYAMHDKKEIDENLRQYCIQKNEPAKLAGYLECFLKKGEGTEADCMSTAGVSASKVAECVTATDKEFSVTQKFNDKSAWRSGQFPPFDVNGEENTQYGVQGSPTLVVNGVTAESGRDSKSLLETICQGFSEKPEECNAQLSSTSPSAGFGEGAAASSDSASCGN
jgi:hypothetical protein